jgi:alpha-ribazole phosphatase
MVVFKHIPPKGGTRLNPCKVILIRHGETDPNKECRYLGHSNPKLNQKGIIQAQKVFDLLREEDIDFILSSDLLRAVETSNIIAGVSNIPVITTPALREMNFGDWDSLTFDEIQTRYPVQINQWLEHPDKFRIPGGETAQEVQERVLEAWSSAALQAVGSKTMVIVTHGGPLRLLMCHLTGTNSSRQWDFNLGPGELRVLKKMGEVYVQSGNTYGNAATSGKT